MQGVVSNRQTEDVQNALSLPSVAYRGIRHKHEETEHADKNEHVHVSL